MSNIAIYARKSVYREDSISIESQIEMCKYEARGEDVVIYQDNGFSGKNTDRPDFIRMMNDIRADRIKKVIVYKLDRISRSILDFSEMMEEFKKWKVDFVSATEKFDTSSPMGRAMLNICIVFAQLERETIQQRVTDAYESRSRRGFYMGGKIPYGFTKTPTVIDGVSTSKYEADPIEAAEVRHMYELYSNPATTLGDVLRDITKDGNKNNRGKYWSTARISEMMRNPVYVMADANVYRFFQQQQSTISGDIKDFDGVHGCYLFTAENKNRKTWDLAGCNLVLAPHMGIIPADIWLRCRKKLLDNHQVKACKPKNSWLAGIVKCGSCGYAMTIRKSKTKAGRYYICSGHYNKACDAKIPTIYADEFEKLITDRIAQKLNSVTICPRSDDQERNAKISALRESIIAIDAQIEQYVQKSLEADGAAFTYINKKISELDSEKTAIREQIRKIEEAEADLPDFKALNNVISVWDRMEFEDKRAVAALLIHKILVYPDKVEIVWKF